MDDSSTDETARVARDAGAVVVDASSSAARTRARSRQGNGDVEVALRRRVATSSCGATPTSRNFAPHFVTGLLGPLLTEPDVAYVKGLLSAAAQRRR